MTGFERLKKDFNNVREIWGDYWAMYGGFAALFSSTYFYAALLLTVVNFGAWYYSGWWDVVISSVPTILGFTLAGLAVFLGMDTGFSKILAEKDDEETTPFLGLVSAFVHFIVIQAIALIAALTMKSAYFRVDGMPEIYYQVIYVLNRVVWFAGYFLYMYALILVFSAVFSIFRATKWYGLYIGRLK